MWMMKLATQWAQLEIISIMTTTTKPNKMQKALEICNSKLSIAYFWAPQCQYWRTRTPHTYTHTHHHSTLPLCTESRPEFLPIHSHACSPSLSLSFSLSLNYVCRGACFIFQWNLRLASRVSTLGTIARTALLWGQCVLGPPLRPLPSCRHLAIVANTHTPH